MATDSQIDEAIIGFLTTTNGRWRKVAMVVTRAADTLSGNLPEGHAGYGVVAKRIEALAEDGRLDAKGYVQYWRLSEVRLRDKTVEPPASTSMSDDDSFPTQLTKAEMVRGQFPGLDALTTYIPQGEQPSGQLEIQLNVCDQSRWFAKDGGHVVKMPYHGEGVPAEEFEVEPGGWNYDDCDGCSEKIMTGQECWVTTGEELLVLCDTCHQKLRES